MGHFYSRYVYTIFILFAVLDFLVVEQRVRLWIGRPDVQISGRSNRTQRCQRLTTAATFLWKELHCQGTTTQRWAPQTLYTLRRNTASIMKGLFWFYFLRIMDVSKFKTFKNFMFQIRFFIRFVVVVMIHWYERQITGLLTNNILFSDAVIIIATRTLYRP